MVNNFIMRKFTSKVNLEQMTDLFYIIFRFIFLVYRIVKKKYLLIFQSLNFNYSSNFFAIFLDLHKFSMLKKIVSLLLYFYFLFFPNFSLELKSCK